jgi:uncharacterized protein involved in exopolysaccharide biosynthesis
MPDLARYVILGAFVSGLAYCVAVLVRDTRARQQRSRNELLARRLARGF